jgi:hypothetical protein
VKRSGTDTAEAAVIFDLRSSWFMVGGGRKTEQRMKYDIALALTAELPLNNNT